MSSSIHQHCLTRYWKDSSHYKASAAFAIVWNVIAWGSLFLTDGESLRVNDVSYPSLSAALDAQPMAYVMLVFPLIGVLMLYHSLAMWLNKTEVKIQDGYLFVNHGPLYWHPGEIKVPVSDIKQAYVEEYSPYSENRERIIRYRLVLQRSSASDLVAESGITFFADAQMLETWLEIHMGLVDSSVEIKKAA